MTAALEDLKAALARNAEIKMQAEEHKAQAADLEYSAECDEAEAADVEADSERVAAEAVLAGKTIPGRVDTRAANLRRCAKAKREAAKKARALAGEVAASLPAARDCVTSAALGFMRTSRDGARADLLKILSDADEPLAEMIASDLVRERLIGSRYSFDPEEHDPAELWSGAVLAEKLIKAIPARLRPEGLQDAALQRAQEIADEKLKEVKP